MHPHAQCAAFPLKPFAVLDLNNRSASIPLAPWLAASVIYPIPTISHRYFQHLDVKKVTNVVLFMRQLNLTLDDRCFATMKNVINCSNVVSIPLEGDQVIDRMLTDQKGINAPMRAASHLVQAAEPEMSR